MDLGDVSLLLSTDRFRRLRFFQDRANPEFIHPIQIGMGRKRHHGSRDTFGTRERPLPDRATEGYNIIDGIRVHGADPEISEPTAYVFLPFGAFSKEGETQEGNVVNIDRFPVTQAEFLHVIFGDVRPAPIRRLEAVTPGPEKSGLESVHPMDRKIWIEPGLPNPEER